MLIKWVFKLALLALFVFSLASYIAIAQENTSATEFFRVGPTVSLRPLDSEINTSQDGIVELFLNNPSLNDCTLETDMVISVPSNIYIYAEDGGMTGGAGTVTGHFTVPPGSSRTITLHIKGEKIGRYPVHFGGSYWPGTNKNNWNPINLDNSFQVTEPSKQPEKISLPYEISFSHIWRIILGGIAAISGIVTIVRYFHTKSGKNI
jgi:hypothetical protein